MAIIGNLLSSLMPGGVADVFTGPTGLFTNPSGAWDTFKNGRTNEVNQAIADENLKYQRERNAIEDARYEEETAYNRAFAEDERDYQRQLQQQIFEREDTALERQVNSLSKLGINPLSQGTLNGLNAGSPVGQPTAPTLSARGGQALHNDFKMQDSGVLSVLGTLMESVNAIDNLNTAGIQRDSIRSKINLDSADMISKQLDNESKMLDNLVKADKLGAKKDDNGNWTIPSFEKKDQDFNLVDYENKEASKNRNVREDVFQQTYGTTDSSTMPERVATGTTKQFERFLDGAKQLGNNVGNFVVNGAKNDVSRVKNFWNKAKGWLKSHTANSDDLKSYYDNSGYYTNRR